MASKSIAVLRQEIAVTEERIRTERRHLRGALHTTRTLVRNTAASRKGAAGVFSLAMIFGILGALRTIARWRRPARASGARWRWRWGWGR